MYVTLRGTPTGESPVKQGEQQGRRSRLRGVPRTVLALGMVSFFTDVSSESVVAVLPLYVTAVLGMSPLAYGFLDGVYQGVSAVVRVLGGWWADRTHRSKEVALLGYGVSALSRFLLLPATGFAAITGTVALDRLGKGLRTGPRDSMIAASSQERDLGRNFGVHRTLDTAGALVGPLAAFGILSAIPLGLGGFHSVFVLSAAAAVVGVAVLLLVVPGRARTAAATSDESAPSTVEAVRRTAPRMRWRDLTDRRLRRLLLAAGVLGLLTVGDGFLYLVLASSGTVGARWFPLLMVGTNAAYLALAVPFGRLADRVGRPRVFLGGHLFLVAAYVVTALQHGAAWEVAGVLLLLGAFYAATDGVLAAIASRLVPEASRASGIAAAQTVVALARFGSSVGFGLLWTLTGRSTAMVVVAVALAVAIPFAAGLLQLRRPAGARS